MASGGKRGGAGERVLEGRHVIGLFMLMMLFSGVFFTLGYVMGRSQYDGQVRAATDLRGKAESSISPKPDVVPKRTNNNAPSEAPTDTAAPANSDWEFYHAGENRKTLDHLKPIAPASGPAHKSAPVLVRTPAPPKTANGSSKSLNGPLIPGGAYTLQVAAFVVSPQTDKYYRVQVGPYADQKTAEAARKGLEGSGFKAIVKH